jgi:Zn-dependent protease with chaperone function
MSSPRLSIFVALLGVLLALPSPLATGRIKNSISNFAAALPSWHKSPESKPASEDQDAVGYKLSSEQYARAVAYSQGQYWSYFLTTAYALLVLCAMIRWQLAPQLRDWSERRSHRSWVQFLIYAPSLLFVFAVLLLPTDVAAQWHERKYGQSLQSWPSWLAAWTTQETVTLASGTLIIALVYFAMRRSPRYWYLFLWMIAVPLIVVIALIQPIAIDPLFNTFEPLDRSNPALVDSIETLVARAGLSIPREHIYLLKLSDLSTGDDAYSEGFGPTKCIFISDTIIATEPSAAILPVVAHEIGHYRMVLDWIEFAGAAFLSLGLLCFVTPPQCPAFPLGAAMGHSQPGRLGITSHPCAHCESDRGCLYPSD